MYFKGTIVITDPCYIIKENPIKCPNEEDFGLPASISSKPFKDYSTPEELAYKAALDYYFSESRKYDDWDKCDFGENMEVLGIHNYISELQFEPVELSDIEYSVIKNHLPIGTLDVMDDLLNYLENRANLEDSEDICKMTPEQVMKIIDAIAK